jgi:hypothetical protein
MISMQAATCGALLGRWHEQQCNTPAPAAPLPRSELNYIYLTAAAPAVLQKAFLARLTRLAADNGASSSGLVLLLLFVPQEQPC